MGALSPAAFADFSETSPYEDGLAGIWAAANYRGLVRDLIIRYKFYGDTDGLPFLVSLFKHRLAALLADFSPEALVPVPMALMHFLARGTQLPMAVASHAGHAFQLPVRRLLVRPIIAQRQARLSKRDRLALPATVFRFQRRFQVNPPAKVLLIDDVLTTGATVRACTEILLAYGVKSVGILTLAADP